MAVAGAAAAQEAPPLNRTDPTPAVQQPATPNQPLQREAPPPPAPEAGAPGESFILQSVRFRGAQTIPEERLEAVWASYKGKPVSLRELRTIAAAAETAYAEAGYPFVAVVVPAQEVQNGLVELEVVEGRISDLTVLGGNPTARRQASAAFEPLVDVQPLRMADVERAYELAQDVPGLTLAGSLRRGSKPGGMDLVIQAERRTWRFYSNLNNFYPEPVGPWGLLFGAEYNGASAYGDQTSLQLYSTLEFDEQQVVRLSHTRRMNARGTNISAAVLVADADPEGAVAPLDLATDVFAARLAVGQPLILRSNFSLESELAFEWTDQKTLVFSSVDLTEDRVRVLALRVFGERLPAGGLPWFYSAELRQGLDVGDASRPGDPLLSRFGADPQALVLRGSANGEQRLGGRYRLSWRFEGQYADVSLPASEEYVVGNLTVGRGYEPGAAFGDRAFATSLEVRHGPIQARSWLNLEPYVFYDLVHLGNDEDFAPDSRFVASTGVGVRFEFVGRARLDLAYAKPLTKPLGLGEGTPDARILVNLTTAIPDAFRGLFRQRGGSST